MGGNLHGVRVLDLSGEPGFFAGRVLGDLGADVIKVEPPAGDPARRRPPFWKGTEDAEHALLWLALNVSKRGLTLDSHTAAGRELLLKLAARTDVVIETERPGSLAERGLGWDVLHATNPRLVLCSITPFGQSGPRAGWRGSDITVTATSGNLWATGDPDRPPVRCALPVAYYHGGLEAAAGITFALLAREQTGKGQHVDVSLQATMVMPNIGTVSMYKMTGNRGQRVGAFMRQGKSIQREIWPCKDGWVSFALRGGPARIPGLVAMVQYMDECGMASDALKAMDWKTYNHNLLTQAEVDELSAEFGGFFTTKTMAELYAVAAERNLMLAPINTAREIVASEQLGARGFLTPVEYPGRGTLRYPGRFAVTTSRDPTATAIAIRRPAPRLGEHTAEVLAEIGVSPEQLAQLRREGVA